MSSQLASNGMHESTSPGRFSLLSWIATILGAGVLGYLLYYHVAHLHDAHGGGHEHAPPLWQIGVLPFALLLGSIAVLPLLPWTHHWWERNINRLGVALGCALLTLVYYLIAVGPESILPVLNHAIPGEYVPFIMLLFSLYVISGGISLKGDLAAHPLTNTAFLAVGAGIASFIGTTGASMLLIRPLLQTNSERRHRVHTVVFFIFLVSNIGGTLLPIGDPPLFLGFLRGVDFFWTFHLWFPWAVTCAILLVIYYALDSIAYRRETPYDILRDETQKQPLRLRGVVNGLWLLGVVAAVAFIVPGKPFPGTNLIVFPFMRELAMLGLVGLSLLTTPRGLRADNDFNYAAIIEVAALFVGIFVAMQVPIEVLNVYGANLGLSSPGHFFWATGSLSAVLDNAPTYVVFFETANALEPGSTYAGTVIRPDLLVGISLGAVFMGAMTYIGNGPNFMVKAIAEQSGIRMPSFFGYVFKYSAVFLLPVFVIVTFIMPDGGPAEPAAAADAPAAHVEPAEPGGSAAPAGAHPDGHDG
jgi:Na+/H+ antiporter NhaD/arsenite permease-like protein